MRLGPANQMIQKMSLNTRISILKVAQVVQLVAFLDVAVKLRCISATGYFQVGVPIVLDGVIWSTKNVT